MSKQTAKQATAQAIATAAATGPFAVLATLKTTEVDHSASNATIAKVVAEAAPTGTKEKAEGVSTAGRKEAAGIVKRTNSYLIDPSMVGRREGWNPRFDMGEIDQLAKSIAANGMLNPIRVKRVTGRTDGKVFELVDGDRRLTAIERLTKSNYVFVDGVPAIIVDKAQDDLTSLFQMFEANSGKVFLPLEEAAAYKRMRDAGLSIKKISTQIGKSAIHIGETLELLDADEDVKEAVTSGAIGKTMAKQIAKQARGDGAKQKELVAAAKSAGKDKTKQRAVKKSIDDSRRTKAAKKGRTLKMRALTDAQLSDLGSSVAAKMADRMRDAGKPLDFDMREWIAKDDKLALAFSFGALEALKAAAGVSIDLSI